MSNKISFNNTPIIQSPYLHNQAVGSDGTVDICPQGIFTRWGFTNDLADIHIPKGELFSNRTTPTGFSKAGDYVKLYRASYDTNSVPYLNIDFWSGIHATGATSLDNFSYLSQNSGFTFTVPVENNLNTPISDATIIVRFLDIPKANVVMNIVSGMTNELFEFFKRYDSPWSLEIENKLMYKFSVHYDLDQFDGFPFVTNQERKLAIETISTTNRFDSDAVQVIQRMIGDVVLVNGSASTPLNDWRNHEVVGENIQAIRFNLYGGILLPMNVRIETYEDTFEALQQNDAWDMIGDFALTLEDEVAYTRFQGVPFNSSIPLDLRWNHYDNQTVLNPDNYKNRWLNSKDGIKTSVDQFINASIIDPRAYVNLPVSNEPDDPGATVSLLDLLNLASTDYHTARMLGLGYLDIENGIGGSGEKYIYAAVYTTHPELPFIGGDIDHVAMTLPTGQVDNRLPLTPTLDTLTYGLELKDADGENSSTPFTDANGYSLYDKTRFVKLNKTNAIISEPVEKIVPLNRPFDGTQVTSCARFGFEYKEATSSDWVNPEVLHTEVYFDTSNIAEPVLIPENDSNPIYTHWEKEEGIHTYAIYAVNWFNRYSGLSNTRDTDETIFPVRQSLLPPFNLSVQYIQEEDPLIFTSESEQNALASANQNNPNDDNCKLRVCFEWDNINANAYQYGDTAEFFFRETPPKKIEGKIKNIVNISDEDCVIETTGYSIVSVSPKIDIFPAISSAEIPNFLDSYLCTAEGQFKIIAITASTGNTIGAAFRVKRIKSLQAVQADPNDAFTTIPIFISPKIDDAFFVVENVNNSSQWIKLDQTVSLINFSTTQETVYVEDNPNQYSNHLEYVGGINELAEIKLIYDSITNEHIGGYRVIFNSYNLQSHQQANVKWHKGSARFGILGKQTKKRLNVVSIEKSNPLTIVVFDPDFVSNSSNQIEYGVNLNVNFHPGYKVYLSAESTTDFNRNHILPTGTINNKKTYFAIRSRHTQSSGNSYSHLSNAATIVARNIQPPLMPMIPLAATFATRPDFYSKSTFTFDIVFNNSNGRTPYGAVVYRSNEMAILQALYKPSTVMQILADLDSIALTDDFAVNRWKGLLKVDNELPTTPFPSSHTFSFLTYGSYKFPVPDNENTEIILILPDVVTTSKPFISSGGSGFEVCLSQSDYDKKIKQIKQVIEDVFSPVTETPIILEFVKNGIHTSSKKPTYKDIVGRLLDPTDPLFDPFPMTVKMSSSPEYKIRFTDYTINGNSKNLYFYYVKEVAINMKQSQRTEAIGPVYLVDANPPVKPKVRNIISREETDNSPAAILFELSRYLPSQNIAKVQIFRTTNFKDSDSTRTMNLAATLPFVNGEFIADSFNDLEAPPFAQPLYYRIVALKKIINENNQEEFVPSDPSELIYTNIFDVKNPVSPVITANYTTQAATASQVAGLANCTLSWQRKKGCYNATFRVFKMNSKGNWEKIWTKRSNQNDFIFPENNDFLHFPVMAFLPKTDDEGNEIYHRFKVEVENASGLLSGDENILIL